MSKSLGNSPDALQLIEEYGADGVRFGMLSCSPAGGDLLFDEKLCEQGRNFANKIWNALRLLNGWTIAPANAIDASEIRASHLASEWMRNRINEELAKIDKELIEYRLSEALISLYRLIWNDFCSWYLEMIKPEYGKPIADVILIEAREIMTDLMVMIHPFMPFISEEIYSQLKGSNNAAEDCMVTQWPKSKEQNQDLLQSFITLQDLVTKVRDTRNKNGIKMRDPLALQIEDCPFAKQLISVAGLSDLLTKTGSLSTVDIIAGENLSNSVTLVSGVTKAYLQLPDMDSEAEKSKLIEELKYAEGFVKQVEKKLSNERFVNSAPESVVEKERQKLEDGKERVKMLSESISRLER